MNLPVVVTLSILVLLVGFAIHSYRAATSHCNLDESENRFFHKYYGITELPFDYLSAEKMNGQTFETVFYNGNLPRQTLMSTSYVLHGLKGSGKSSVTKYESMQYNDRWVIPLTHDAIRDRLTFFQKHNHPGMNISSTVATHWSKEDFAHMLLVELVLNMVQAMKIPELKERLISYAKSMPISEKLRIIDIACVYFGSDVTVDLEEFVCDMLDLAWWQRRQVDVSRGVDTGDTIAVMGLWNAVKIRPVVPGSVNLMVNAHRFIENKVTFLADKSDPFTEISSVAQFFQKALSTTPAIAIDGLDEVSEIFREPCSKDTSALTAFVTSAMSPRLEDMMVTGKLYWMYSFPGENMDYDQLFSSIGLRNDKLLIINMKWSTNELLDYADSVLDWTRKRQVSHCADLPDIRTLLDYNNLPVNVTKNLLGKLRHPRDLHIFMQELIVELNKNSRTQKFQQALLSDVEEAYTNWLTRYYEQKNVC